jgi:hypothetical protein
MSFADLFNGLPDAQPPYPSDQRGRRHCFLDKMLSKAKAVERAAELVSGIVEKNEERMQFDDEGQLVITGKLAIYRVDLKSFMTKMSNPFSYHSFDVVEVHPKHGLIKKPETACVQVRNQDEMPAYDLLAGYILGLLNDDVTWLQDSLQPLQRTLFALYGLSPSPLTSTLTKHLEEEVNGIFDFINDTFTFEGTNGWKWRLHFGQPLVTGFKIEYQKPRQTWWNHLFNDHVKETTGHYVMNGFFETVSHLSRCPAMLKTADDWETDPIFIRRIAADYPALAKVLVSNVLEDDDYDPHRISTYYDDYISTDDANTIVMLDQQVRQRAYA